MRLFDLSQPVFDGCPNCPAHPTVETPVVADHPMRGWRLEMLRFASHTGTHLDAPLHKLADGRSIDAFPLESFTGPARLADLSNSGPDRAIGAAELSSHLSDDLAGSVVLLNTGWGLRRARTDEWLYHSPFLAPDGAEWLVARRIKGVGIDHYSIAGSREPGNARTHETLLQAGIWIVEDLCFRDGLDAVLPGATFVALPLFLPGFSGAPCRAVLVY